MGFKFEIGDVVMSPFGRATIVRYVSFARSIYDVSADSGGVWGVEEKDLYHYR